MGDPYWYRDFRMALDPIIQKEYTAEWTRLFNRLHDQIKAEMMVLKTKLNMAVFAKDIVRLMLQYKLRDYQAYDVAQFKVKYEYNGHKALILSEPRTGKTRVALAVTAETSPAGSVALVVCPKSAQPGWVKECQVFDNSSSKLFRIDVIQKISDLKNLSLSPDVINVRVISYELFKRLQCPNQVRILLSMCKKVTLLGDEIHRLRNFKTQQSKAIFDFKDYCERDGVDLGIIGMSGTPTVKDSSDVFGLLSLVNDSRILFKPTYMAYDIFKEYFYYCEDTTFGKNAKALRRADELNFIVQMCSVQTKQKELDIFKGYDKRYKKIELDMDAKQRVIYDAVYNDMEYDDQIDCQNKLVQLTRLQQICIDPSTLVSTYDEISPKLRYVTKLAISRQFKFIVAAKKNAPLEHLQRILTILGIGSRFIKGSLTYAERIQAIEDFSSDEVVVLLMQLDTGREALTIPQAKAIVFLDRDFAQGFNEQAEARMTPIDGSGGVKYVIDLIMKGTKEEGIYQTLVVRKKSIDAINTVFKPRKET
jgi:SNF2 family DNA or RNA helicase